MFHTKGESMRCVNPIVVSKYRHDFFYYLPAFISRFLFKHFGIRSHLKSKIVFYAPCGLCEFCRSSRPRSVFHLNRLEVF